MKRITVIILAIELLSCNGKGNNNMALQKRIDSLEMKVADSYKPGFGEFMSSIQSHHAKLWFAGKNENWKLADFEIHEIMEAVDDIKKYETDRKESKMIEMIEPALDSVNNAIVKTNTTTFNKSYNVLTNTCNKCHRAVDFEFNIVKIPSISQFSNQDFSVHK